MFARILNILEQRGIEESCLMFKDHPLQAPEQSNPTSSTSGKNARMDTKTHTGDGNGDRESGTQSEHVMKLREVMKAKS